MESGVMVLTNIIGGAYQEKLETAKNLFHLGLSIEQISTVTGLSGETLQQLSEDLQPR